MEKRLTIELFEVILFSAETVLDDQGIRGWKVGHSSRIKFTIWNVKKWFQGVHKGSKVTIEVGFLYMQSTHSTKSWKFCWISKGGKERTLASEGSEKKMLLLSKIVHNLWQGIYGKNMVRNVKDFRPHGERSWVPLALYEKWFRWKLITNLEKNSVWPIQGQNSVWWTSLK